MLFWKIWLAAAGVIVAIAVLLVTLVTLQFSREYSRLLGERLLVIGTNAAAHFASAADVGLPLSSVRNADVFLDIPSQADPVISSVRLVDAEGRTLRETEQDPSPAPMLDRAGQNDAENRQGWYYATEQEFVAGIPIFGADGALAGSILVSYPASVGRERVLAMVSELALASFTVVSVAVMITGVLLRVWLAGQISGFRRVEEDISEFERRGWTLDYDGETDLVLPEVSALSGMLDEARRTYLGLVGQGSQARAPVDRRGAP